MAPESALFTGTYFAAHLAWFAARSHAADGDNLPARAIRAASAVVCGGPAFANRASRYLVDALEPGLEPADLLDVMDKFVALTVEALELNWGPIAIGFAFLGSARH
jgi:hypothetical protein